MTPEKAAELRKPFPKASIGKLIGPCICWSGAWDDRGYGRQWWPAEQRVRGAYENAWEMVHGPVPDGLELDHLCMNHSCINPAHLEPVTHQENMRRAGEAGLLGTGQSRKTHCPQGHAYDASNTYSPPSGNERQCRICRRAASERSQRKNKGAQK